MDGWAASCEIPIVSVIQIRKVIQSAVALERAGKKAFLHGSRLNRSQGNCTTKVEGSLLDWGWKGLGFGSDMFHGEMFQIAACYLFQIVL